MPRVDRSMTFLTGMIIAALYVICCRLPGITCVATPTAA